MLLIAILLPLALAFLLFALEQETAGLVVGFAGYIVLAVLFTIGGVWRDRLRGNFDLRTWIKTRGYRRV